MYLPKQACKDVYVMQIHFKKYELDDNCNLYINLATMFPTDTCTCVRKFFSACAPTVHIISFYFFDHSKAISFHCLIITTCWKSL